MQKEIYAGVVLLFVFVFQYLTGIGRTKEEKKSSNGKQQPSEVRSSRRNRKVSFAEDSTGGNRKQQPSEVGSNRRNGNLSSTGTRRNTSDSRRYRGNFASVSNFQNLLQKSSDTILYVLSKNENEYSKVFKSLDKDLLKAVTKVIVKICRSSSTGDKYKILKITLCKEYVESCKVHICNNSARNIKLNEDIKDIFTIFQNGLEMMPYLCWYHIQSFLSLMIDKKQYLSYDVVESFDLLKEKVGYFENRFMKTARPNCIEEFQGISVFPATHELITRERNFIRPNIIKGPYYSVSHYLDVFFRLQREDFLNPIREDLCDYIDNVQRTYFNIKVYDEIEFFGETCNKDDICYTVHIKLNKKQMQRLKSSEKKCFLTGSLLLFTDDNFRTILKGLVVNSDDVTKGIITVSFEDSFPRLKHPYKMVECIVFFDPYHHVLKVLQTIDTRDLPMRKYIVDVETSVTKPSYLPSSIPKPSVKLNQSQQRAFDAAFSQEFVVIQGPPGTGKTFLGLTITKQLIHYSKGPILVVCYTNHALDQFLEGLLSNTQKLVRLGSQSKNKALQEYSLRKMRGDLSHLPDLTRERRSIQQSAIEIKNIDKVIQKIRDRTGIVDLTTMPIIQPHCFTNEYLFIWLLEDTTTNIDEYDSLRIVYSYLQKNRKNYYQILPQDLQNCLNLIEETLYYLKCEVESLNDAFNNNDLFEEKFIYLSNHYQLETEALIKDYRFIEKKLKFLEKQLNKKFAPPISETFNDPSALSTETRWQLYHLWLEQAEENLQADKSKKLTDYRNAYAQFSALLEDVDVATLKKVDIIGMTTSCAARMHQTLQRIGCSIVVVEEAAEVSESHIITALTKHCQHLILLGDHQQLKPSTADYHLEQKYNLGISLFERMVINNIQCHTLNVQHRMRPEIARLITPVIYPDLKNSTSVYDYPVVRGVQSSLFFIHHKHPEELFGESSKLNRHEAAYLVKLAEYLLKVGYNHEDVTILAAYAGQLVILKKEVEKSTYKDLTKITVDTVDNFQGEESKIILLSLVRNNDVDSVGFLKIENRICVALSRAKEGFYMMGNLKMLARNSKVWEDIKGTLKRSNAKGYYLSLVCENHGSVATIKTIEDFEKVPEGGCDLDCNTELKCGHICQRKCHVTDVSHEKYKCMKSCLRQICDYENHWCKKLCHEECGQCLQPVNVILYCGHEQIIECYMEKDKGEVECRFEETIRLACGHNFNQLCSQKYLQKVCKQVCNKLLDCGHHCLDVCHIDKDPEHLKYRCEVQTEKYFLNCKKLGRKHSKLLPCYQRASVCTQKSTQIRKECSHLYKDVTCHKDVNEMPCTKSCKEILPCGHACGNTCGKKCGPCNVKIPRQSACGHFNNEICGGINSETECNQQCNKKLRCGHRCPNRCKERCATMCPSTCSKQLSCGHFCIACCGEPCGCKIKRVPDCSHKAIMKCTEKPKKEHCKLCNNEELVETLENLTISDY